MGKIRVKKRDKLSKEKKKLLNYNNATKFIIIIALVIIIKAAITSDKSFITAEAEADLGEEAMDILKTITDENMPISVLNSNELVDEKIGYLDQMDYGRVKDLLGVESDFCIFFEDVAGNVVKINDVTSGIGSSKIHVNGKPCE